MHTVEAVSNKQEQSLNDSGVNDKRKKTTEDTFAKRNKEVQETAAFALMNTRSEHVRNCKPKSVSSFIASISLFIFYFILFYFLMMRKEIIIYIYIYGKLDCINNYIVEMAILQIRSQNRPEMSTDKVGENKIEVGGK